MAAYQEILFHLENDVATITLNRPEQLNGMTSRMRAEMLEAIRRDGDSSSLTDRMPSFHDREAIIGTEHWNELNRRFAE